MMQGIESTMLTVACVLKSGGIYDATWVARLQAGVAKHLAQPHRFVCLSDVDVPCERIPLEHGWPGWWSKIELFKLQGPVLFFDLDTVIVGNLSDMAELTTYWPIKWSLMLALRDFYRLDGVGSGVMAWRENVDFIYWEFLRRTEHHINGNVGAGDQGYLEKVLGAEWVGRLQHFLTDKTGFHDQIVSYKVHCRDGIPPNARVVCLHGRPKFEDMPVNDPVRVAWEDSRQCPLCHGADQHELNCSLEGKDHYYSREWPEPEVDWNKTLRSHGMTAK